MSDDDTVKQAIEDGILPEKNPVTYMSKANLNILLQIRACASALDDCLNEFPDNTFRHCSECFQALHDALYQSRHIEPKLYQYFSDEATEADPIT